MHLAAFRFLVSWSLGWSLGLAGRHSSTGGSWQKQLLVRVLSLLRGGRAFIVVILDSLHVDCVTKGAATGPSLGCG